MKILHQSVYQRKAILINAENAKDFVWNFIVFIEDIGEYRWRFLIFDSLFNSFGYIHIVKLAEIKIRSS